MPNRLAAKRMLGAIGRAVPRAPQRRVILLYHSIGQTPWALSTDVFREQMAWLASVGTFKTLKELIAGNASDPLQVSITFDDGYVSLVDRAMPILSDVNAHATVFLNTGWIDDSTHRRSDQALGHYPGEHFLLWKEVGELVAHGWSIGSHGVDHLDLTRENDERVVPELVNSKSKIENIVGSACSGFAYTWGRNTPRLQNHVMQAGYKFALAGTHGPLGDNCNLFAIPRINVATEYTLADFKAIVAGDWDYLKWASILRTALTDRA